MITLSRIFVYPIKSTAPVELAAAEALTQGLAADRRYVVTDARGRFLTARRFPRMVLIRARPQRESLIVQAPGAAELELDPSQFPQQRVSVRVWDDQVDARWCGPAADAWFTRYLGVDARLCYMDEQTRRPARDGDSVSFADASPLLLLSAASVADLNTRLAHPVGIRNFRPNIVVSGTAPYAEDDWPDFRIGEARFRRLWPCARCILTTIDPDSGVADPQRQPLETLRGYRRSGEEALFGLNVGVAAPGRIAVGQPVLFT